MDAEEQYAWEKLNVAVEGMATSAADIRTRLYNAFLSFHTLRVSHFKDAELKEILDRVMSGYQGVDIAPREQGTAQASLRAKNDEECEEVADNIWAMYELLRGKRAKWMHGAEDEE